MEVNSTASKHSARTARETGDYYVPAMPSEAMIAVVQRVAARIERVGFDQA